jgi:hypothetical protein
MAEWHLESSFIELCWTGEDELLVGHRFTFYRSS